MVKRVAVIALIATTLCLCLSSASGDDNTESKPTYKILGNVFCDPCRVQFETKLSKPVTDAKIILECRNRTTEEVTYIVEGKTRNDGSYELGAKGDHEEEICDVRAEDSTLKDCNIPFESFDRVKIILTQNVGIPDYSRFANPLGFMTKESDPKCEEVLKELFPNGTDDDQYLH